MKKVLIATEKPFAGAAVDGIRSIFTEAGYELLLLEKYKDQSELINAAREADAMIVRSDNINKDVIDAVPNIKIIVRAGAGFDNIDIEKASTAKMVVMNTPGQNSNAVAELALGMMIYQARNHFNGSSGTELLGKTLGLHAYGNVGRYVAKIAQGFGMTCYAYDPFISEENISKDGVIPVKSAEELYKTCQYVSLHIPANSETKKSIDYTLLSLMPEGATLVNTARKEVIDEDALMQIFEARPDFRYVSDIAPECASEIIEKYAGRFFFTPKKMGAQTEEANINAGLAAARQIVAFFEKGDTTFQVNSF